MFVQVDLWLTRFTFWDAMTDTMCQRNKIEIVTLKSWIYHYVSISCLWLCNVCVCEREREVCLISKQRMCLFQAVSLNRKNALFSPQPELTKPHKKTNMWLFPPSCADICSSTYLWRHDGCGPFIKCLNGLFLLKAAFCLYSSLTLMARKKEKL